MKAFVKLYAYIIGFFVLIFLIMNLTGWLSVADIRHYVEVVTGKPAWVIALVIGGLLAVDVFFSVPTIFLVTSSGFLLGFWPGLITSITGMMLSGLMAYVICHFTGKKIIQWVLKDDKQVSEVAALFERFGPGALLFARALPMLPEATCCMAGMHRMSFGKFLIFYLLGTVPYAAVLVWLGSVSSKQNPYPALGGIVGMYIVLWSIWLILVRRKNQEERSRP